MTEQTSQIDPQDPAVLEIVARAVEEQTAALKRNRDEILSEKAKKQDELKRFTEAVGGEDGLRSLMEMRERMSKDELGQLLAAGKHDEWLERKTAGLKSGYTKEIESLSGRIRELEAAANEANSKLTGYRVRMELDGAFAAAGVDPNCYEMVAHYLSARIGIDEEGDFFVKDQRGDVSFSGAGKKMTVRELVESLRETQKALFLPTTGGGARGGSNVRGGVNNPWVKGPGFNLTEQGRLTKTNPELAARLKAEAASVRS